MVRETDGQKEMNDRKRWREMNDRDGQKEMHDRQKDGERDE